MLLGGVLGRTFPVGNLDETSAEVGVNTPSGVHQGADGGFAELFIALVAEFLNHRLGQVTGFEFLLALVLFDQGDDSKIRRR